MAEAERLPPPLPPRLDWFVHTQMGQLAQDSVPEWFHGAISREPAPPGTWQHLPPYPGEPGTRFPGCVQDLSLSPSKKLNIGPLALQKDPANVDYEDLFLYSSALAEEATRPVPGLGEHRRPSSCSVAAPEKVCDGERTRLICGRGRSRQRPMAVPLRPALPHPTTARKPSAEPGRAPPGKAASSCPARPFREAGQRLWSSLKALPAGRIAQPQFRSALAALRSSLQEARPARGTSGPRPQADSRKHSGEAAWKDSVSGDPCVATASDPSQPQAPRPRDASARKAARPVSWSGATPAARGWHPLVARALSSREATPGPEDVAEPAEDMLPEEYLPPPPFAPGYC
uniref:hematopoietic SH2 domain-containing protein n=1 Tax=Ictidomys tridecemlineatus TaxID=43179 RepID=UPI001A9FB3D9|nr:hematopoietic SH2 domain-containing protein [Ictidomys tridecemlineatus]